MIALDISISYQHIELYLETQKIYTVVLSWGKYKYVKIPIGVSTAPDIFQEKMYSLMEEFKYVQYYLDDLSIFSNRMYAICKYALESLRITKVLV